MFSVTANISDQLILTMTGFIAALSTWLVKKTNSTFRSVNGASKREAATGLHARVSGVEAQIAAFVKINDKRWDDLQTSLKAVQFNQEHMASILHTLTHPSRSTRKPVSK
jgi:hypothetical protein